MIEMKTNGYQRPDYPPTQSALKAIRWTCLDCVAGSTVEVERCCDRGCAAWPFRFGTSPATAKKKGREVER
jgi:hypothetical protein